jgi:hypothetical protein
MIKQLLQSKRSQKIVGWIYWILLVLSSVILVFTGINQMWDSWLLRISTTAGILAAFLGRLLPQSIVEGLSGSAQGGGVNGGSDSG